MIKKSVKSEPQNLNNSRNWSNKTTAPFSFYEAMNYPIPDSEIAFSRTQKNPHLESFLQIIRQRQWIFRYIPFVETVFLANSLSFNACKENSDIDLFIITKSNHLRIARFITSLVMAIIGIKRNSKTSAQKFCLSFFISSDLKSLQSLLLNEQDIYLPYRIAHLVPLYNQNEKSDFSSNEQKFYQQNLRVKDYLPNRTPKQHIFLNLPIEQGSSTFKKTIEKLTNNKFWSFIENLIIKLRTPRIQKKIDKNPDLHHWVIYTNQILKFHHDKRAEISQKINDIQKLSS